MADRPPYVGLKGKDDANLEMGEEAPKSLPSTLIQAANSTQRRSARIAQRVAAYEANMSSKSSRSMGRNLEVLPISEFAVGATSNVSDHSMSAEELEDDDLLDEEEEYLKELEDQRIIDEKNGHFERGFLPPILPTATREEAAAFFAASFNAASMTLDTFVGEGEDQTYENPRMGGGSSSREGRAGACSIVIEQSPCMGRGQLYVNPGRDGDGSVSHGGGGSVSAVFGQPCLEPCLDDETINHACMGNGNSPSFGSTQIQKHIPCFKEKEQRLISKHGQVDGENIGSLAAVEDLPLDLPLTDFAEETLQLDLMEVRSMVCQQSKSGLKSGLARGPMFSSISPAAAQVIPLLDHSLIPSPSRFISQPIVVPCPSPKNSQPTSFPNKPQPKKHPKSNPHQPKYKQSQPTHAPHFKNNSNSPLPPTVPSTSAAGKELAVALFTGRQPSSQPKNTSSSTPQSTSGFASSNMEDFPPISASILTPAAAATFAESFRTAAPAAAPSPAVQHSHILVSAAKSIDTPPQAWADLKEKNACMDKGMDGKGSNEQLPPSAQSNGDGSNIHFVRSMADVLKKAAFGRSYIAQS